MDASSLDLGPDPPGLGFFVLINRGVQYSTVFVNLD
jgi:hypothetical protein